MSRGAAYLRLVRIPNVFTALGDPLAGAGVATERAAMATQVRARRIIARP